MIAGIFDTLDDVLDWVAEQSGGGWRAVPVAVVLVVCALLIGCALILCAIPLALAEAGYLGALWLRDHASPLFLAVLFAASGFAGCFGALTWLFAH